MTSQLQIANWFNQVYQVRGFKYLRPLEAYHIFCPLIHPVKKGKHLDVACGLGLMLKALESTEMDLYGIDISEKALEKAAGYFPYANYQLGNAQSLPYEHEFFDRITCLGSLERMLDRKKALSEMYRVGKPTARYAIMVRNAENFTWKFFQKPLGMTNKEGHQDALNLNSWSALFQSCGFVIESIYPDHWPYFKTMQYFGKVDTSKLRKFPGSITWAYEFIFVLRKQ
jgi:ubiquinone/menaquinone biosynthesis C-methylase UbiE